MRHSFLFLLIALSSCVYSQDYITKKNGDELKVKVVEITNESVKYKKWDNIDGPIYNIPVAEVFVIKYENGTREVLSKVETQPKPATPGQMAVVPTITKYDSLMKLSNSNRVGGIMGCVTGPLFIVAGSCAVAVGIIDKNQTSAASTLEIVTGSIILVGGAALTIIGPIALVKSKKQKAAAQQYKPTAYILPVFNSNCAGISLTLNF